MLDSIGVKKRVLLESLFPDAPEDAIDLLRKLLCFNPERRLTAEETLKHPYLKQFHNPQDEPTLAKPIQISFDDNQRFTIDEYRKSLYKRIIQRRKEMRRRKKELKKARLASQSGAEKEGGKKGRRRK